MLFCHWPFTACTHTIGHKFNLNLLPEYLLQPSLLAPERSGFLITTHNFCTQFQQLFPMDYSCVWNRVDFTATQCEFLTILFWFCIHLHATTRKKCSQEHKLCLVWCCFKRNQVTVRVCKRLRWQVMLHATLCSDFELCLHFYSVCPVYHLACNLMLCPPDAFCAFIDMLSRLNCLLLAPLPWQRE